MNAIESADLVIMMVDAFAGFAKEDEEVLKYISNISGKTECIIEQNRLSRKGKFAA